MALFEKVNGKLAEIEAQLRVVNSITFADGLVPHILVYTTFAMERTTRKPNYYALPKRKLDIVLFTGYELNELNEWQKQVVNKSAVVICGR